MHYGSLDINAAISMYLQIAYPPTATLTLQD